jgi:hypothetical protein
MFVHECTLNGAHRSVWKEEEEEGIEAEAEE